MDRDSRFGVHEFEFAEHPFSPCSVPCPIVEQYGHGWCPCGMQNDGRSAEEVAAGWAKAIDKEIAEELIKRG